MSVLSVLSGLATAAGKGYEGYAEDEATKVKQALAEAAAKRQTDNDAVLNHIRLAGIDPDTQGRIAAAREGAVAPIRTKQRVDEAVALKPIEISKAVEINQHPAKHFAPVVTTKPDGSQEVSTLETTTGALAGTGATPGLKATGAKPTESQEKSYLFYNLMDKALPRMTEALGTGNVRKAAISAYMASPGLVSDLANLGLNETEQSYIRNLRDFAAGVLRKESGAAVTHDELRQTFQRYGVGFGDAPEIDAEKAQAAKEYLDSMRTLAGPAVDYYAGRAARSATSTAPASVGTKLTAEQYRRVRQHYTDDEIRAQGYVIP